MITYCKICGNEVNDRTEICPKCGVRLREPSKHGGGWAPILSILVPGLGQLYCGRFWRGLIILFMTTILLFDFFIIGTMVYLWQVYDALKLSEENGSGMC
jgi:hypothetical protein